jgi:hypothetical protein
MIDAWSIPACFSPRLHDDGADRLIPAFVGATAGQAPAAKRRIAGQAAWFAAIAVVLAVGLGSRHPERLGRQPGRSSSRPALSSACRR